MHECGSLLTIGRVQPNDIVIPDPKASRNHATVRILGDGRHYIADMGSSNGTFLNTKRVVSPCPLENGDIIAIGDHELKYECEEIASEGEDKKEDMDAATMVTLGNKIVEITILVSDIRNYTPLSASTPEDMLAKVLGDWCRSVSEAANRHCGIIDKFIGDAVMIRWMTARSGVAESVSSALKMAYELNEITKSINDKYDNLPGQSPSPIGNRCGDKYRAGSTW